MLAGKHAGARTQDKFGLYKAGKPAGVAHSRYRYRAVLSTALADRLRVRLHNWFGRDALDVADTDSPRSAAEAPVLQPYTEQRVHGVGHQHRTIRVRTVAGHGRLGESVHNRQRPRRVEVVGERRADRGQ